MHRDDSHVAALRRAKRQATGLLVLVALVFVASFALPPSLGVRGLRAVAEAAMVGALADWFAVTALFRHIPLGWVGRHTAIIPRNKDRIASNLATFVQTKFLDAPTLIALVRRHDPAAQMAGWLTAPGNAQRLGQQLARLAGAALEMLQDRQVERWLQRTLRQVLGRVNVARALGDMLAALTHGNHHQAVLDDVLSRISTALRQERTRMLMAETIVTWLKREHPLKEKMLPTDWLGGKGAQVMAEALDSVLADVAAHPEHALRAAFHRSVERWVQQLLHDPDYASKLRALQHELLHDRNLADYLQQLWARTRSQLQADLAQDDSGVSQRLTALGSWLGQSLAQDAHLRQSMNDRLERWAESLAPEVSQVIAQHIEETVRAWDAQQLSELVEQHIGRDLQWIRINGTVVGGLVGLVLFVLTQWMAG